jgi:hypothetical protein
MKTIEQTLKFVIDVCTPTENTTRNYVLEWYVHNRENVLSSKNNTKTGSNNILKFTA